MSQSNQFEMKQSVSFSDICGNAVRLLHHNVTVTNARLYYPCLL